MVMLHGYEDEERDHPHYRVGNNLTSYLHSIYNMFASAMDMSYSEVSRHYILELRDVSGRWIWCMIDMRTEKVVSEFELADKD